jgi:hypothetical protein
MKRGIELSADITCWGSDKLHCMDHVHGITTTSCGSAYSASLRYYSLTTLVDHKISPSALSSTVVTIRTNCFNIKISSIWPTQYVYFIVRIVSSQRNGDYYPINTNRRKGRKRKEERM